MRLATDSFSGPSTCSSSSHKSPNHRDKAQMMTRREAVRWLGSASAGACFALSAGAFVEKALAAAKDDAVPALAPGSPMSPERLAIIEAFKKQSDGLEKRDEARPL